MTDQPAPAMEPAPQPRPSRWLKPVLVVSLALNLAVAGLVVGAIIRGGPPMRTGMHADGGRDFGRDSGLGLMSEGLSRSDRQALRRALIAAEPDLANWRERAGAEFGAVITALRAEPFDAQALQDVLDAQSGRMQARMETGRRILVERIAAMTPAERADFAARLEDRIMRLPGGSRDDN